MVNIDGEIYKNIFILDFTCNHLEFKIFQVGMDNEMISVKYNLIQIKMESHYLNIPLLKFKQGLSIYIQSLNLESEDQNLVQESLLHAILNRPRYRMEEYLNTLTSTIKKKAFINNYRRIVMQNPAERPEDTLFLIYKPASDSDVTTVFNKIIQTIEHLNERLIKPFKMYVEGYKYTEIADAVRLKIETVKKRILIARSQLILQGNES